MEAGAWMTVKDMGTGSGDGGIITNDGRGTGNNGLAMRKIHNIND